MRTDYLIEHISEMALLSLLCAQAAMASIPFDEECSWHLRDYRGSVLAAVDEEGKGRSGAPGGFLDGLEGVERDAKADLIKAASFLPYGELRQSPGKRAIEGFTGQRRDDEAGLDNFNARVYNSSLCSFLQPDPGFDPRNINGYTYCAGNPVRHIDPSGRAIINYGQADVWCVIETIEQSGSACGRDILNKALTSELRGEISIKDKALCVLFRSDDEIIGEVSGEFNEQVWQSIQSHIDKGYKLLFTDGITHGGKQVLSDKTLGWKIDIFKRELEFHEFILNKCREYNYVAEPYQSELHPITVVDDHLELSPEEITAATMIHELAHFLGADNEELPIQKQLEFIKDIQRNHNDIYKKHSSDYYPPPNYEWPE